MKLGGLKPEPGSTKRRKRIGRGVGSGHGKTSCRGNTGAGQHSAPRHDARFEGGQMPFYRRIPKRGFVNPTRKEYAAVNLTDLAELDVEVVTVELLRERGLVGWRESVKVLGDGERHPGHRQELPETADGCGGRFRALDAGGGWDADPVGGVAEGR